MSYGMQRYHSAIASTATQEDLIVMLYEGAVRFLEKSVLEFENRRLSEHKSLLMRGRAIIEELENTLDFDKGGDIALQLYDLYDFMLVNLTKANLNQDMSLIREVVSTLNTLLEGWREAIKQYKNGAIAESTGRHRPVDATS